MNSPERKNKGQKGGRGNCGQLKIGDLSMAGDKSVKQIQGGYFRTPQYSPGTDPSFTAVRLGQKEQGCEHRHYQSHHPSPRPGTREPQHGRHHPRHGWAHDIHNPTGRAIAVSAPGKGAAPPRRAEPLPCPHLGTATGRLRAASAATADLSTGASPASAHPPQSPTLRTREGPKPLAGPYRPSPQALHYSPRAALRLPR